MPRFGLFYPTSHDMLLLKFTCSTVSRPYNTQIECLLFQTDWTYVNGTAILQKDITNMPSCLFQNPVSKDLSSSYQSCTTDLRPPGTGHDLWVATYFFGIPIQYNNWGSECLSGTHCNYTQWDCLKQHSHTRSNICFGGWTPETPTLMLIIIHLLMLPILKWFIPLLGPLTLVLLLIFGSYLFSLLVKFVSTRLQQFHIKVMMLQRSKLIPSMETILEGNLNLLDKAGRDFWSHVR